MYLLRVSCQPCLPFQPAIMDSMAMSVKQSAVQLAYYALSCPWRLVCSRVMESV